MNGSNNPMYHKPLMGQSKMNMIIHQPKSIKVRCIDTGKIYISVSEAAKETGCDRKSIDYCCKGIYQQSKSYHWEYVDKI